MWKLALILTILSSLSLITEAQEISLENPVRSAAEDEIISLPDYNEALNFKQYSGYLEASKDEPKAKKFLHYWFVESQSNPSEKPLMLWLNGGPGCSSISNLLKNNGPVQVNPNGTLSANQYSFNKLANVLYLDAPVGTGFSYAIEGHVTTDDDSSAQHNYEALKNFFLKFPEHKNKSLYLAGESYAGVYIPMLALQILQDPSIKLRGLIIGNGYMDAKRLGESFIFYSYYHGLIDTAGWRGISTYCCDGNTPGHKQCHFAGTSIKCLDYIKQLSSFILAPKPGLNPQNIYETCPAGEETKQQFNLEDMSRESVGRKMLLRSLSALMGKRLDLDGKVEKGESLLNDDNISFCASSKSDQNYMNREDVKRALHVPERLTRPFVYCSPLIFKTYNQTYPYLKGGMASQVTKILNSKNIELLMFNGDIDLVSNFIGNDWFTEELKKPLVTPFREMTIHNGPILGFVKNYNQVIYATIKGAGHSPTLDKKDVCYELVRQFLSSHREI